MLNTVVKHPALDPLHTLPTTAKKIMVGLSGGVDSSVAALLLQQEGYTVQGLFMKNWEEDDAAGHCNAAQDYKDVQSVCNTLGIERFDRNFSAEYWDQVFTHCLVEFGRGRTPNPDILCNKEIKFKLFLQQALDLGADAIATGHYARIDHNGDRLRLLKAFDRDKDQSYFLYTLNQAQLAKSLFPLGLLSKQQVRAIAQRHGLTVYAKQDSTGICFIGERNFKDFLSRFIPPQPGPIRTPDGVRLGTHEGLMYHTIGQRKGLGIGGRRGDNGSPWYVVGKELADNALIVVQGHDHPRLYNRGLTADQLHWVAGNAPKMPFQCGAKTRYRQDDQQCIISGIKDGCCTVVFERAQRALTAGQSVVFYQGDECLGGGIIR